MFRSSLCLLFALAACSPPDAGLAPQVDADADAALPVDAAAPPALGPATRMDLRALETFIPPGDPLVLKAGKVRAGATVRFLMSRDGQGPGRCDLPLGGSCLNLLEPTQIVGTATANSNGIATFSTRQQLAEGDYTFQAVVAGAHPRKSNVQTVHVVGPCVDDLLEDNDTIASASIYSGPVDLQSCERDRDVFSYVVPDGEAIIADASFARADGDLDLELRDATSAYLASGTSSDANESVRWLNDTGGPVTVYVGAELYSDDNLGGIPYGFSIRTVVPHVCGDLDAGEPDNDLASAQTGGPGSYSAESCTTDDDWYALDLLVGDVVDVGLAFDAYDADLDLFLLDDQQIVIASSVREGRPEHLSKRIRTAGRYYVVVSPWTELWEIPSDGGAAYTLDIDVLAP